MKINKNLVAMASTDPTKKTMGMTVVAMCSQIDDGEISLPLYQRDLSWTIEKCVALLNYQLLGKAPVSPISVNNIKDNNEVPQVSFIDREIIEQSKMSVVDGQQRLSTNYKAYINHHDFRNIVLDLSKGKFLEIDGSIKNNQIPVGILLNKEDKVLNNYISKYSSAQQMKVMPLLYQVRSKMRNYNYTVNMAENLTEDEQIEWFEVLNNAGSRVSIIQMRFSKLKAHGIDVYKDYTSKFNEKLSSSGYDFSSRQETNVSYPIAALNPAYAYYTKAVNKNNLSTIPSDTKEEQLCNLEPNVLKKCFTLTLETLDKVIDFIQRNKLSVPHRIDYINYLIGFYVLNPNASDVKYEEKLINWYNTVNFTNQSNSRRRKIYNDLISM